VVFVGEGETIISSMLLCSPQHFLLYYLSVSSDLYCCRDILLNLLRLIQISGSVIKHQLISSLTLGMALRLVLDSLRKPADSKVWILL